MQWNQQLATQYGQQSGLLQPGETATGGLLIQRARDAGQMNQLNQAVNFYNNPNQGGVVPMTVEPLHQFERDALTQMANPPSYGQGSVAQANQALQQMMGQPTVNPLAQQYLEQAGEFTRQGAAPVTLEEAQGVANPYAQALQDRLTQQGERARAEILARQGRRGASSFGDTATGEEMGFLQEEMSRGRSDIDFKTYESAFDRLMRQRELSQRAGGTLGQLGSAAQGVTASGAGIGLQRAGALYNAGMGMTDLGRMINQDRLQAGRTIRDYNQRVSDLVASDILGQQQFEPQQLAQIQSLLDIYKSGTSSQQTPGANTLQQLGGLAGGFGDYLSSEDGQSILDRLGL